MTSKEFAPVTPGEMLKEEFLAEYWLSQSRLAKAIGISPNRIAEIVNNRRRITADTALRLGLYFGNSPEFWMNLQAYYDLNRRATFRRNAVQRAQRKKKDCHGSGLSEIVSVFGQAATIAAATFRFLRHTKNPSCSTSSTCVIAR